jgi:hypothetical protein
MNNERWLEQKNNTALLKSQQDLKFMEEIADV